MAKSGTHQRHASPGGLRTGAKVIATGLTVAAITIGLVALGRDFTPWATAVTCPIGTPVGSTSTCEVVFTSAGSFAMPSNVSAIEALIVGSGGKSLADTGYAGGGGEVKVVTLANTGNLTITVGTSGAASPADDSSVVQAGGSTVTAVGGGDGTAGAVGVGGGVSPNKGGDGGNGTSGSSGARNGGSAIQVDALAGSSSLFDGVTDWYGGGGAGAVYSIVGSCLGSSCTYTWNSFASGTPGTRAGYVTDTPPVSGYPVFAPPTPPQTMPIPVMNAAAANSGGGAGATNWGGDPSTIGVTLGASGIVILRYVVTSAPAPAPAGPVAVAEPDPTPTPAAVLAPPSSPSIAANPLDPLADPPNPNTPRTSLSPGGTALFLNGSPQSLSIAAQGQRNPSALLFSAQGWQLQLSSVGYGNQPIDLGPQQSLVLESQKSGGGQSGRWAQADPMAVFGGSGFRPNSPIRLYLLPNSFMGQVVSNAAGAYAGRLEVPANLPSGPYTLQVNGFAPDGSVRSLSVGVTVRSLSPAKIKVAKTRVFFDPLSANLSSASRSHLRAMVKRTGHNGIKTVAVGYVQPTARIDNDQSLSMKRAKNLANYLRSIGLKGTYVTLGKGVASQQGATARRVTVKVTYRDSR